MRRDSNRDRPPSPDASADLAILDAVGMDTEVAYPGTVDALLALPLVYVAAAVVASDATIPAAIGRSVRTARHLPLKTLLLPFVAGLLVAVPLVAVALVWFVLGATTDVEHAGLALQVLEPGFESAFVFVLAATTTTLYQRAYPASGTAASVAPGGRT